MWRYMLILVFTTTLLWTEIVNREKTFLGVGAQPCPAETPLYGGAVLDGSDDEYEQYFVVADDDLTRVTQFRYCKCCINKNGDYEHFRGFEVGITSPISGF